MSAYVVNKDHIDLLVTAAYDWNRLGFYCASELPGAPHNANQVPTCNDLGAALWAENVRSVNHRYNEQHAAEPYRWERISPRGDEDRALTVLKACACFDYQACETDDYEKSWAAHWIQRLRLTAISKLEGYDAAPGWDYCRAAA